MWRLVSTLEIDEAQAIKVLPTVSQHQRDRDTLISQGRQLRLGLRQQLAAKDSDEKLLEQMAKIRSLDDEVSALDQDFEKRLGRMLTATQRAHMLLFEDSFRTDLRDMARRMRGMSPRDSDGEGASRRRWGESR